jgi:hypothetical protein
MTTKAQIVTKLKAEYPTLKVGDDERGYTDLSETEYEATISQWADNQLASEAEATAKATDKAALLAKLGITEDEAKLLLG